MDDALQNRYEALGRQDRWSNRLRCWFDQWLDAHTPEELHDLLDRLDHRNAGGGAEPERRDPSNR